MEEDPEFSIGNLILGLYLPGKMHSFFNFILFTSIRPFILVTPVLIFCMAIWL
jgi:hypothetical protein